MDVIPCAKQFQEKFNSSFFKFRLLVIINCYPFFIPVPPVLHSDTTDTIIGIFGETSNISCQFFGSPVPEIIWFNDSLVVDLTSPLVSVVTSVDGFVRSSTLVFSSLNFFDDGDYVCQGRNNLFELQATNSSNISLVINRKSFMFIIINNTCLFHLKGADIVGNVAGDSVVVKGAGL